MYFGEKVIDIFKLAEILYLGTFLSKISVELSYNYFLNNLVKITRFFEKNF
jgi:hypothetical protein